MTREKDTAGLGILLITRYARILRYTKPDVMGVFFGGGVVRRRGDG